MSGQTFFNRELSWLSFNYRVLQEAKDPSVPIFERIKFLAIYSSNLDEFYRVRVASIRALLNLKEKSRANLSFEPIELLKQINKTVTKHQEEFGSIYRNSIIPELENEGIYLKSLDELNENEFEFIDDYYKTHLIQHIQPILIVKKKIIPFLQNRKLYLAVRLKQQGLKPDQTRIKHSYALIEIPSNQLPRFIKIPSQNGKQTIVFIDDIIRNNLAQIFSAYDVVDCYSVKLTRDADLNIDDEFSGNLLKKIQKGLSNRNTGIPSRFLYDSQMPKPFLKFLKESLLLTNEDLVKGGHYHNFNDFFTFPIPKDSNQVYEPKPQLNNNDIDKFDSIFAAMNNRDQINFFPFQSYNYIVKFLEEAASDPHVTSIKMTQYRVAENSKIVSALIKAAKNGKDVMAFVEVKARFDEELNIESAKQMQSAGIKVFYSFPGLKVHAKIALVTRVENNKEKFYGYYGTGNFNEKTAKIYCDLGLLTVDPNLTEESAALFQYLAREPIETKFKNLLIAQFNLRKQLVKLIDNEIANALDGKKAKIILKMNGLEDKKMINRLYEASNAGVSITIIVRGICCLVPGIPDQSSNIKVFSIIDRYLEHTRIFIFHNDGDEKIYAASADWMKRNLSRRIEVAFPILDKENKKQVKDIIKIQLADNTHSRIIDQRQSNKYKKNKKEQVRSQYVTYDYLKKLNS